jgi:superfamily II RNA helicase
MVLALARRVLVPCRMAAPTRRFVAISATIPNVYDLARWLARDSLPARAIVLGPEYRPVPLHLVVRAYPAHRNPFLFDAHLNFRYGCDCHGHGGQPH